MDWKKIDTEGGKAVQMQLSNFHGMEVEHFVHEMPLSAKISTAI
jgi:hypothetical protein